MYYVYDYEGYYIMKTDSFRWARKCANINDGYVMKWCPFDGKRCVYDVEWDYDFDLF